MSAATLTGPIGRKPQSSGFRFGHESAAGDAAGEGSVQWLLRRNCSLAPRQVGVFYASLCAVSIGIASLFWQFGATYVLPFAWLEMLAVGAALLVYARHAGDGECIRLDREALTVERASGRHVERVAFQPAWVRVEPEHGDRSLIELSGQGRRICVGRYVRPELRQALAEELRWALRRRRALPPGAVG